MKNVLITIALVIGLCLCICDPTMGGMYENESMLSYIPNIVGVILVGGASAFVKDNKKD